MLYYPLNKGAGARYAAAAASMTLPRTNRRTYFSSCESRSRLSLLDSRRVLEETEGIGRGVVGDLESQRESLLRSSAHVRDTDSAATKARRVLRSIARKDLRHRLVLYMIISMLVLAILGVVYWKISRRLK